MSKLSDKVKEIKEREINKQNMWETIARVTAQNILDVNFDVYESPTSYILKINETFEGFHIYVRILKARTMSYDIYASKDDPLLKTLIFNFESLNKDCVRSFTDLGVGDEFVDKGQLLFYIEKNLKDVFKEEKPSKLEKEIDNGFRKQDSRMPLGGETLENDIAFNEYLHRKYKGIC